MIATDPTWTDLGTSLGPFVAVLVVALFLLTRSDRREDKLRAELIAAIAENKALNAQALAREHEASTTTVPALMKAASALEKATRNEEELERYRQENARLRMQIEALHRGGVT